VLETGLGLLGLRTLHPDVSPRPVATFSLLPLPAPPSHRAWIPMATQEFYIRNEDETEARGPFNLEQLTSLIDSGQITTAKRFTTTPPPSSGPRWKAARSSRSRPFPEKKRKLKVKAKENLPTLNSGDRHPRAHHRR
jgi:hypothetical protein